MSFEIDAIVRIVKQPSSSPVSLVGEVGYITEVRGEEAYVRTLQRADGKHAGSVWVPFTCLLMEHGEEWLAAKAKADGYRAQIVEKSRRNEAEWNLLIKDVAKKHRLPTGTVRAVYEELSAWQRRNRE